MQTKDKKSNMDEGETMVNVSAVDWVDMQSKEGDPLHTLVENGRSNTNVLESAVSGCSGSDQDGDGELFLNVCAQNGKFLEEEKESREQRAATSVSIRILGNHTGTSSSKVKKKGP